MRSFVLEHALEQRGRILTAGAGWASLFSVLEAMAKLGSGAKSMRTARFMV
jgi:hypothetical protein